MQEHKEGHLKFLLTFAGAMTGICMFLVYWFLLQIEINKTVFLPTGLESVGSHEDFAKKKTTAQSEKTAVGGLEEETEDPNETARNNSNSNANGNGDVSVTVEEYPTRYRITKLRNVVLAFTALALSLLTYLLLVVSNANLWLSLLGVAIVIGAGIFQQICEELRRRRLDRIVAIITLLLLAASFMSLSTFASRSIQEGEIYKGKARIIGFDYDNYDNKDGDVTRTDLEVAWGGEWGCPREDGKTCQAFIQGAMCESEDANNNRALRLLEDGGGDDADGENAEEEELEDEVEEEEEDLEDEEQDYEAEEEENEELEEENEELEEEVEEYEEYSEELEEDVEEEEEVAEYTYYYDDDLVYDSYWDEMDWGSVWGEYACYDLFDYDLSGATYDADEAPGKDDWPFVNIYGNCKKCEAYIVDYFSTEHFQNLQSYRVQGRNYLIVSAFGVILTMILHFKHRIDPIAEKELELLPHDGGALA